MADSERTEQPTGRKRQKTREKGRVARSRELPQSLAFASVVVLMGYTGDTILSKFRHVVTDFLALAATPHLDTGNLVVLLRRSADAAFGVLSPIFFVAVVFSLVGSFGGGGFIFSVAPLRLNFERLSPLHGLEKLKPKIGGVELVKSLLYTVIVCYVTWRAARDELQNLPGLALIPPAQSFQLLLTVVYRILFQLGIFFAILAMGDFLYQRYLFEESLKMTKQEVKDDFREVEGDPKIKGRIRRAQREMARRRMMSAVPKADVVVTNPTHFAVAIAYRPAEMSAPTVVAKGMNYMALKIREIAKEHEVPIIENPPLAQALYKTTEIGKTIPAGLFKAVAEVLAYLIKFKGRQLRQDSLAGTPRRARVERQLAIRDVELTLSERATRKEVIHDL